MNEEKLNQRDKIVIWILLTVAGWLTTDGELKDEIKHISNRIGLS